MPKPVPNPMPNLVPAPMPAPVQMPVQTEHAGYRSALGMLRASATRSADREGAIVALASPAWPRALREAAESGAAALVVDEPGRATPAEFEQLRSIAVPVVLDRRRLRFDHCEDAVAARAGGAARAIVVECVGARREAHGLLRDGIGWARVLAGGPLSLRVRSVTGGGLLALLDGPAHLPVTISLTYLGSTPRGGVIRASALAETRTEVTIDLVAGVFDVETFTRDEAGRSAQRYESAHRLALRRALAAVESNEHPADRAEFEHDSLIADLILQPHINFDDLEHRRYVVP